MESTRVLDPQEECGRAWAEAPCEQEKGHYTQSSGLTLVTLHSCRMAHRGDDPGESQGGRPAGTRSRRNRPWVEPRGGRALWPTTSPKAPRGPQDLAARAPGAEWSSGNGSPNAGPAPTPWTPGGEMCSDWPAGAAGPPTHGDDRQPSGYLRRRGLAQPALAPALERNMYRFRSQVFTGISAATAAAASHPRRSSPLSLARDSPLSRPPHRRTSRQCSSIG